MTTKYEITARHSDGRSFLIGFTARKSRVGLLAVLRDRGDEILVKCGFTDGAKAEYTKGRFPCVLSEGWTIGFTGRTKLEAGYGL